MSSKRIVYSTDSGRICPDCNQAIDACKCSIKDTVSFTDGIVRLKRDVKGRKGSGVTLVEGTGLAGKDLKALAKKLKAKCGSGGSIKNGLIEIQGDKRELLKIELEKLHFKVKISGA